MKNLIPALALTAFLFSPLCSARADDSGACTTAKAGLEAYFAQMPDACVADAECGGFYYRLDSCDAPVILPVTSATPDFAADLEKRQNAVRKICYPEGNAPSNRPPCSPMPFKAACVDGKCVDKDAK
jgi:hypothetical protein